MNLSQLSPQERIAFLRAEQIKGNFLIFAQTTFSLNCLEFWYGFHWHPWSDLN